MRTITGSQGRQNTCRIGLRDTASTRRPSTREDADRRYLSVSGMRLRGPAQLQQPAPSGIHQRPARQHRRHGFCGRQVPPTVGILEKPTITVVAVALGRGTVGHQHVVRLPVPRGRARPPARGRPSMIERSVSRNSTGIGPAVHIERHAPWSPAGRHTARCRRALPCARLPASQRERRPRVANTRPMPIQVTRRDCPVRVNTASPTESRSIGMSQSG